MKSARKTIGLIAGGFKPFTAGHYNLVQKASSECDKVILFVSTGGRYRPGELGISWAQMKPIWIEYIKPAIMKLKNVQIKFVSEPISNIFELLIAANEDENNLNTYQIYSAPEDVLSYADRIQMKYWPRLFENDQVILRPVSRKETAGISGTLMRSALASGDKKTFVKGLPSPVRIYGSEIYRILKSYNKSIK